MEKLMHYLDPETIAGIAATIAGAIVAIGAAIGRVRRAVVKAIKKASGKGGGTPPAAIALIVCAGLALAACETPQDRAEAATGSASEQAEDRPVQQRLADRIAPVSDENRAVRACYFGAAFIELQTAKVRTIQPERAASILGNLTVIQSRLENLRRDDPTWRNTRLSYVALAIASVLKDTGREKVLDYLSRGFSFSSVLFAARQATVDTVVGSAVWSDVGNVLRKLEAGEIDRGTAWAGCQERLDHNRTLLEGANP